MCVCVCVFGVVLGQLVYEILRGGQKVGLEDGPLNFEFPGNRDTDILEFRVTDDWNNTASCFRDVSVLFYTRECIIIS